MKRFLIICALFCTSLLQGQIGQHQLSFFLWKFDYPVQHMSQVDATKSTKEYKEQADKKYKVCKSRAKHALKEIEAQCDAAIVCLQSVPLMPEEIEPFLKKYKLVGFHKQNAILQNLEWKSIACDKPEPNSLGVSVRMTNTHNPAASCYIYCTDCSKVNHEKVRSVLFKRIGLPIVYFGHNLVDHPFFTSLDIDQEHSLLTQAGGVSFYPKEMYRAPHFFRFAWNEGYDLKSSSPSPQAAMESKPLYTVMTWPKFYRYVEQDKKVEPVKQTKTHKHVCETCPPRPTNKKPVFLPVEYPVEAPRYATCKPFCVVGKCSPLEIPQTLRRLQSDEFTVASFNFKSRMKHDCFHDRKVIQDLQNVSADIVCLQGIDNVNISPLLNGFVKVKRNSRCAILLSQRSSLTYSNAQDEVLLKGISASFYDAGNPTAKIKLYCFDFDGEAQDTYDYNPHFAEDNTIIVGANLAANSVAFSKLMDKGALYTALCYGSEQICYTALYNKVSTVAASISWDDEVYDLYTGYNLLTRYGRTMQVDSEQIPLFATFKWNGLSRYKVDAVVS